MLLPEGFPSYRHHTADDGHEHRKSTGDAFLRNYPEGQWISRERERLTNAIDRLAGNEQ